MKYWRIPKVIDAVVFKDDPETLTELSNFIDDQDLRIDYSDKNNPILKLKTLEGVMDAKVGDYIIKGIKGEFYPCKPDIFKEIYAPIKNEPIMN